MVFLDIWRSFRALPLWVQIWVFGILVPVNSAAIFFLGEPGGIWVAVLAIGAMLLNAPVMLVERGFSKAMALPHLLPWSLLVLWLVFFPPQWQGGAAGFLWLLLAVDSISLLFDYPDALNWWRGDRRVAGK